MNEQGCDARFVVAPLVRFTLVLLASVAAVFWLRRRYLRFEVVGESMLPTFHEGDFLLARRLAPGQLPRTGDLVLAVDPREPSRTLLKRVSGIDLHGQVTLLGDNAAASTDSRHFGAVPPESIIASVTLRYWPLAR